MQHRMTRSDEITDGNGHLALGRGVRRSLDAFLPLIEDPRDAVGLRQNGAVADAEAEPEADSQVRAVPRGRLAQYEEAHAVTRQNTEQQNVTQFPSRSHDHRCPIEPVGKEELLQYRRHSGPSLGWASSVTSKFYFPVT